MNRREVNNGRHAGADNESDYSQVAALATKITALPKQDSQATNDGPCDRDWNPQRKQGFWALIPCLRCGLQSSGARVVSRRTLLLVSLAWLITLVIGLLAALRILYHDGAHLLIWINAFTRYVYLPSYACLFVALWKRRRWLAVANLAIVGCHIFWIAPDFMRDRRFDAASANVAAGQHSVNSVRIFFANVHYHNQEFNSLVHEIEETNPDVIILVEFPWLCREVFLESPTIAKYPYGHGFKPWRVESVIVYSKLPVQNETEVRVADRIVQSVDIRLGSQTLRLVGLHAPRPMHFRDNDYDGYWKQVVPLLLGAPHPSVAIGDFNATQYSLVYKQLKAGGLRSAHEDRGRGHATTWPNGMVPVPPIRIDQALLSPDVLCQGIAEGVGRGSDHKPLILDVQFSKSR